MTIKRPPKYLKAPGKVFYLQVNKEYLFESAQDLERLVMACECLDTINSARSEIQKAGEFFIDRWGQPRAHPGFTIIRDQKALFIRIIRELGLDLEIPEAARPPAKY
jgi:phage terminase small subunit